MPQIFGEFSDELSKTCEEYFIFGFSPKSVLSDEQQLGKANGLLAEFLTNYLILFYANRNTQELKEVIGHITNELLENAWKFRDKHARVPLSIEFYLEQEQVVLCAKNSVPPQQVANFQSFIEELLHSDREKLAIRQIKNTETPKLGLLTIIDDYEAQLGWKFETLQQDPEVVVVSTMVCWQLSQEGSWK